MRVRGRRCLWRQAALVTAVGAVLAACTSGGTVRTSVAPLTVLTCQDSAGHGPGDPGALSVGGIGSPGLRGGFTSSYQGFTGVDRQRSKDGHLYVSWKDPVAVAPTARPYRTITVVSPA